MQSTLARERLSLLTATTTAANPRFVVLLVAVDVGERAPEVVLEGVPPNARIRVRFADGTQDSLALRADDIELTRAQPR